MLKYCDPHFANHARFKCVVLNTSIRKQVSGQASYLSSRRKGQGEVTIEDIEKALNANAGDYAERRILNSVIRSAGQMFGTCSYQNSRRRNLDSYVHALDKPTLFITLNAADLQPDSIARLMPDYELYTQSDPKGRIRMAREHLRENHAIAAAHFHC
jgi:hypothetical protein